MMLRLCRLLKLCRLLRLIKLCKELYLLATSFVAALRTLLWVAVLLLIVLYCAAVFCTILVGQNPNFARDNPKVMEYEAKYGDKIYRERYFGSIMRSMTTLFQIFTLDNWNVIVRPIAETHQPLMLLFFSSFIFLTTFGLLNLLVGVIVDHTVNAAKENEEERERFLHEESNQVATVATHLFSKVDTDGEGTI